MQCNAINNVLRIIFPTSGMLHHECYERERRHVDACYVVVRMNVQSFPNHVG